MELPANRRAWLTARMLVGCSALLFVLLGVLLRPQQSSVVRIPTSTGSVVMAGTGSLPQRLRIPRIGVDAQIEPVGVAHDGTMGIPSTADAIGWYQPGIVPGKQGNAVMAGHLDTAWGAPAVFWHLQELQPGDDLFVDAASGATQHYRVVRIETYDTKEAPLAEIFGEASSVNLQLVTCNGGWIHHLRTYSHRLVVFTTLVSTGPV